MELLPGLSEFRRAVGGGRGRHFPRRGGRGRGCGRPRRGCRPCGPPGGMRPLARMFQNHPLAAAMRERFCQPEAAPADHRDPARQTQDADSVAENEVKIEQKKQEVREAKAKVKALKKEMKACRKEMKTGKKQKQCKKLDGEVTGHLDTEEKSVQIAGATVLKTWKVKNTGSSTWSEDTIAIFHSGNQSLVVPGYHVIQFGAVEPNDVAYIRCMLSVPEVAGTYSLVFRLSGPNGRKFGARLMTEIEVKEIAEEPVKATESTDEPKVTFSSEPGNNIPKAIDLAEEAAEDEKAFTEPAPSAPVAPSKPFQFQKQKDQLKAMGFEMDDETLESVLVVAKGNIGQAIQLLM